MVLTQTTEQVLDDQQKWYKGVKLNNIAPWNTAGSLPYAYILKKNKEALEYELRNMVFASGILLLMQIMGAGMGGRMSPVAAKVTCIVKEHKWQQEVRRSCLHL